MRAGELRRSQGLLRLVPRPAPRHAQDQGRLVHGRRHRRDPVPVVPPPVDALARVQKVQLNHLQVRGLHTILQVNRLLRYTTQTDILDLFMELSNW